MITCDFCRKRSIEFMLFEIDDRKIIICETCFLKKKKFTEKILRKKIEVIDLKSLKMIFKARKQANLDMLL